MNERNPQVMSLAAYKCTTVERAALSRVALPPETDTYQPVGHDWLLDQLEDAVGNMGFTFGASHHGLSHDNARYFGLITLEGVIAENPDYTVQMGVRNSLDKRFGAQVAFGAGIIVCANLCFGGQYMLGRKHTTHIKRDMPQIIAEKLSGIPELAIDQDNRFTAYHERNLSEKNADHLIMNMLRAGAVNTARIEKVISEWDTPTFDHGDKTVWRAYNAATQALKGVNVHEMPQRTMLLNEVCDREAGFRSAIAA